MKIIELDYKNIEVKLEKPISILLGYFDGLHLGHISLINEARKSNHEVAMLTFDKPISRHLDNGKSKEIITSLDDKARLLNKYSLDYLFVIKLNKDFLNLSKDEFVTILEKLNVKEIFVGDDYRFAKNKEGDPSYLKEFFKVHEVPMVNLQGEKISTQKIIDHLKKGDVKTANELLGRAYEIKGEVIHGYNLGEKLDYPTMNLKLHDDYVLPKYGVYKTIAYISGVPHLAITNVGVHPTINELDKPLIEVHIPHYNEDDYGKTIYLSFIDFIREERKFVSVEELQNQIKKDIEKLSN